MRRLPALPLKSVLLNTSRIELWPADLLRAQQQAISIPNIQKTVADYYGLQVKDLLSKRRTRSLARTASGVSKAMTSP